LGLTWSKASLFLSSTWRHCFVFLAPRQLLSRKDLKDFSALLLAEYGYPNRFMMTSMDGWFSTARRHSTVHLRRKIKGSWNCGVANIKRSNLLLTGLLEQEGVALRDSYFTISDAPYPNAYPIYIHFAEPKGPFESTHPYMPRRRIRSTVLVVHHYSCRKSHPNRRFQQSIPSGPLR
jgi:hypothetical protein